MKLQQFPLPIAYPAHGSTSVAPLSTDTKAAITLLSLPFFFCLSALVLAVCTTASGIAPKGTPLFYVAAFSYAYLTTALMCMPAYIAGCIYFWWVTTKNEIPITRALWQIPIVSLAVIWFPAVFVPQETQLDRLKVILFLALVTTVINFLWIALVRIVIRLWRKI